MKENTPNKTPIITLEVMMGVLLGVFSFIISCHLKASWQGNLP